MPLYFLDVVHLQKELPLFERIGNAYIAGPALRLGSSLFYGREDVFQFIQDNLDAPVETGPVLLLTGTRRVGMTSISRQLPQRIEEKDHLYALVDCQRIVGGGMAGFFWRLADDISEAMRRVGLHTGDDKLAPSDFKDEPQYVFEHEFLPWVWQQIGDRSLLLAIDEIEYLYDLVSRGVLEPMVFSYLRALMQHQERMAFVLFGSPDTQKLFSTYDSTFFNLAKTMRVSCLGESQARRLIEEPVAAYGVVYDDLAVDEILRLTGRYPYWLQLVCSVLVDRCNEMERNYVTIQTVRDIVQGILEYGRVQLVYLWHQSSLVEKAALSALASLLGLGSQEQVTVGNIVLHLQERIGKPAVGTSLDYVDIRQALERLVDREILRRRSLSGNAHYYEFTAGLYQEWITKRRPLDRIGPELVESTDRH
jgi:hypothetical protein